MTVCAVSRLSVISFQPVLHVIVMKGSAHPNFQTYVIALFTPVNVAGRTIR